MAIYHFYEKRPNAENVADFTSFKHFVNHSMKGGFDNRTMPIEIQTAISNSLTNYLEEVNGQPSLYSTQVHQLSRVIFKFIGDELNNAKYNNSMLAKYSKQKS